MNPDPKGLLAGVHPDLVKVVLAASEDVDFRVTEGARTVARQRQLVAAGASQTMNSNHLPRPTEAHGMKAHAVDVAALVGGQVRWDWPLYHAIAAAMKAKAKALGIPIVWGGDWKTFKDGPHFELDRKHYP